MKLIGRKATDCQIKGYLNYPPCQLNRNYLLMTIACTLRKLHVSDPTFQTTASPHQKFSNMNDFRIILLRFTS